MVEKEAVRKQMKAFLLAQPESEREMKSDVIFNKVIALDKWKRSTCIGITISRTFEVDTMKLIKQAWREGKQVAVPKCIPATRALIFYLISTFEQLEIVYAGLYEPKIDETIRVLPNEIDLLILPGLAFTEGGHRLGFGGGYYDRFLPTYDGETLALAFDFQIQPSVSVESHDMRVDLVMTNHF